MIYDTLIIAVLSFQWLWVYWKKDSHYNDDYVTAIDGLFILNYGLSASII